MRHALQVIAITIAAVFASSCATTMTVSSHVEHGLDLSQYRTFEWGPPDALPTGDPRLDRNAFFKDHVEGAIERGLAARGLAVASGEPADVLIHYHACITKRMDVNRIDATAGYCQHGDCPSGIVEYEAGTLILDLVDARTNRLVWRGWAQNNVDDLLHDQDRMVKTIDQAVSKMLLRFGPSTLEAPAR